MKQLLHYESSNLHSTKYDPDKRELYVTFMNNSKDGNYADKAGKTWIYRDVSPATYETFEKTQESGGSVGKLFHNEIRSKIKGEPVE